jgi:Na+/H+-dicarboxylate symporter
MSSSPLANKTSSSPLTIETPNPNAGKNESMCKKILTNDTFWVILCAGLGIGCGIAMADGRASDEVISWVGLPGVLFLRALRCLVLPLIFVNIVIAVIDMLAIGNARKIGGATVIIYMATTTIAAIEGTISAYIFKGLYSELPFDTATEAIVSFNCTNQPGTVLHSFENGTVACIDPSEAVDGASSEFIFDDVNDVFQKSTSSIDTEVSLSQQLQDGIFKRFVPINIVQEFLNDGFLGIIMFAIMFAVAINRIPKKRSSRLYLIEIFSEMNEAFITMITWVIKVTPPAVFSLIAEAVGTQDDLGSIFSDVGILIVSALAAYLVHLLVFFPIFYFAVTKRSVFRIYKTIAPAQMFAFGAASSAATLPINLQCVAKLPEIPATMRNFVLPIGATINMDGVGIYIPTMVTFLAVTAGLEDELTFTNFLLIGIMGTVGAVGAAPVPAAGLVVLITTFNTVFTTNGLPNTFSYILAIEWLLDRFTTVVNVTSDAVICGAMTKIVGMEGHTSTDTGLDAELEEVMSEVHSFRGSFDITPESNEKNQFKKV